jgi:hypothetical protein
MKTLDTLVTKGCEVAMRAAAKYIRTHGLKADMDVLIVSLRANAKIRLPKAMADAKEALDCGMAQVAEATFLAEMALAGIDAAKECCSPTVV